MLRSSAPESAATVANPDLKLWPAYFFSSKPAFRACFLIINTKPCETAPFWVPYDRG